MNTRLVWLGILAGLGLTAAALQGGCVRCGGGQVLSADGECRTPCNQNEECPAVQVCNEGMCGDGTRPTGGGSSGGVTTSGGSSGMTGSSGSSAGSSSGGASSSAPGSSSAAVTLRVTAVTPARVWQDVGTMLEVRGEGFVAGALVRVGNTRLSNVTVVETQLLRGQLGAGLDPGSYSVTVDANGQTAVLQDALEILPPIQVQQVWPPSRWNDEPHQVELRGTGLRAPPMGITRVLVDNVDVLLTVDSDAVATLGIAVGLTPGMKDVVVEREGGPPITCTACFEVTAPVVLTGTQTGLLEHTGRKVILQGQLTIPRHQGGTVPCATGTEGCLDLRAARIVVEATAHLQGNGAGYGGGGGGGGGHGQGGGTCGTAAAGGAGSGGGAAGDNAPFTPSCDDGGNGGAGGVGGGPHGGSAGTRGTGAPHLTDNNECDAVQPATVGGPGGTGLYAPAATGDTTTDDSVWPGSGGGGGGGGGGSQHFCGNHNFSGGSGGGGGAGGRGGAAIMLRATESLDVLGSITSRGLVNGGNGGSGPEYNTVCRYDFRTGGGGGSANSNGTGTGGAATRSARGGSSDCALGDAGLHARSGGAGGGGAGGGVLLQAPTVQLTGSINVSGSGPGNGGTVKLFHGGPLLEVTTVTAGRVYQTMQ